jgi:8-oxo-dGTP pyrophosphatase MutT (NUDIX family)
MPSATGEPAGFSATGSEIVWRGRRLAMARSSFRSPDGEAFEREFLVHPGAVGIIAVDGDGAVCLVRQFRGPMGTTVLEMPAGTCDVDGEPPIETARRELAEEAGLRAAAWEELAPLPVSPGVTNQVTRVYLATELSPCDPAREGPEERAMSVERVPLDEVLDRAAAGERIDAPTLAGVALALRTLSKRRS